MPAAALSNESKASPCCTGDTPDAWVCFDLKEMRVRPTGYALRHGFKQDLHMLRHWRLEASIDKLVWITLKEERTLIQPYNPNPTLDLTSIRTELLDDSLLISPWMLGAREG